MPKISIDEVGLVVLYLMARGFYVRVYQSSKTVYVCDLLMAKEGDEGRVYSGRARTQMEAIRRAAFVAGIRPEPAIMSK